MRILSILMLSLFLSNQAMASGVSVCGEDELTNGEMSNINAKPIERTLIKNKTGEVVGAITFTSSTRQEFADLYLCGDNSNGYYIENARSSDWVGDVGTTKAIGDIYNDEYDVTATAKTIFVDQTSAYVEITAEVKFTGEPSDADYAPFTTTFFATLSRW